MGGPRQHALHHHLPLPRAGLGLLGSGKTPDISHFARGLSGLILRVRDLACASPTTSWRRGLSLLPRRPPGGLVSCRLAANQSLGDDQARATWTSSSPAPPRNGIDMASIQRAAVAERRRHEQFQPPERGRLPGSWKRCTPRPGAWTGFWRKAFASSACFCLIGTNPRRLWRGHGPMSRSFTVPQRWPQCAQKTPRSGA